MPALLDALARWRPFRALVVGDLMLDRLTFGNVDRLCNDAPVPVFHAQRTEARPGGAANVALDLLALRASVTVLGVIGNDDAGRELQTLLSHAGLGTAAGGLAVDPSRPTTVKHSLVGLAQHRHAQKMFRIDHESAAPIAQDVAARLTAHLDAAVADADVVCLEDYNKGVCTPELCRAVIDTARKRNVPVFVDPAAIADYSRYRGCSTMTPNRSEAQRAARLAIPDDAPPEAFAPVAQRLLDTLDMEAAVVTLDRQGALLLERATAPGTPPEARAVPTQARRVYDVTGAGDMVLAALAAARANHLDWFDAVRFANAAAGLEVEEFGVVPIPLERIHADLLSRERATRGKVRTVDELLVELAALRAKPANTAGKPPTVVLANGCFDVLHAGHVSLLRRAAALGDFLIVAINSDASVRRLKGPGRPVYTAADRATLLGELGSVGAVVVFDEDTPEALIRALRPDVLVKGAQYAPDSIPGGRFVIENGGRLELLEVVPGRSTTSTVERIRAT